MNKTTHKRKAYKKKQKYPNNLSLAIAGVLMAISLIFLIYCNNQNNKLYEYSDTVAVCVDEGQTLWGIAGDYTDSRYNLNRVIYDIEELSDCTSDIQANQTVIVPLYNAMQ